MPNEDGRLSTHTKPLKTIHLHASQPAVATSGTTTFTPLARSRRGSLDHAWSIRPNPRPGPLAAIRRVPIVGPIASGTLSLALSSATAAGRAAYSAAPVRVAGFLGEVYLVFATALSGAPRLAFAPRALLGLPGFRNWVLHLCAMRSLVLVAVRQMHVCIPSRAMRTPGCVGQEKPTRRQAAATRQPRLPCASPGPTFKVPPESLESNCFREPTLLLSSSLQLGRPPCAPHQQRCRQWVLRRRE